MPSDGAQWLLGWRDDGAALYLLDDQYDLVEVAVDTGATFEPTSSRNLFRVETNSP